MQNAFFHNFENLKHENFKNQFLLDFLFLMKCLIYHQQKPIDEELTFVVLPSKRWQYILEIKRRELNV